MITADELKKKWTFWVKQLTGVEEYFVSRSFDPVFSRAVKTLNSNTDIDVDRFCRLQVLNAIEQGKMIYPTWLTGNAVYRYRSHTSEDDEIRRVKSSLLYELRDFAAYVKARGFNSAVAQDIYEFTPLFIGLMYLDYRSSVPEDVLEDARSQIKAEPAYRKVLPAAYVRLLGV